MKKECTTCGACCIAISISPDSPALPNGKEAGERCPHLNDNNLCSLFGKKERPKVCGSFPAMEDICGTGYEDAMRRIELMELATKPD